MELIKELMSVCGAVRTDEPMKMHTTFKIGGNADIFCEPENTEELKNILKITKNREIKPLIIGNGSNMLISDNGIRGVVIKIGEKMSSIEVCGNRICAGAGAILSRISSAALKNSLSGFECLSGIPGSLGGAIYMNAGAYGAEISQVLKEALCVTPEGEIVTIKKEDMDFGYRQSVFMHNGYVIVSAVLEFCEGKFDEIDAKIKELTKARCEKQPLNLPSAGSVFKRPEGYFAGKLIEDSGLKGYKIGGAEISEKHAGFIVNTGGAAAKDVLDLIKYAQDKVFENFGVKLEPEIKLTGETQDI